MLAVSTTTWWVVGFAVGGAVVLVAATLLLLIIVLARRIVGEAAAITLALDGAMRNSTALFDIAMVNHNLERITRGLKELRGVEAKQEEQGVLGRMTETEA